MGLFKTFFTKNDDNSQQVDDSEQSENISNDSQNSDYSSDDTFNQYSEDDSSDDEDQRFYDNQRAPSTILGQPSLINIIANSYWSTDDVMQEYFIMRETMKHRTYGIPAYVPPSGYPRMVDTQIFQELLSQGNVDLTMDIVPRERRNIMKELSNSLNVIRSNAEYQQEKGQTFQLRENVTKYNDIDNLLDEVQFDENRLYDLCISLIVYGNSERDMNKNFGIAEDLLANQGISITPYVKRVKSGYLQGIPIGSRMPNLDDTYRNVDRKSLSVMDPARNSAGKFNGGIPFGLNRATPSQNTEFLNVFGTKTHRPINYNMGIIGESGAGKSTSNKIKMAREISILGYEHRSIDPDGEYVLLAKHLGQLNLTITSSAKFIINPCAVSLIETPLEEEMESDVNGRLMSDQEIEDEIRLGGAEDGRQVVTHEDGQKFVQKVNISQMISNVEGFMNEILTSNGYDKGMDAHETTRLEDAINAVINKFGITANPNSLFINKAGTVNNKFYDRMPKPEPTLSDIYDELKKQNTDENGKEDLYASRLLDGLKPYLRTGSRPIFDGQTYFGKGRAADLNDYLYVNFNISQLEGSLKRVAYYVITQYLWERWMKSPEKATIKKVLDADEILQFIDDPVMFGFFELIVRRCRKRNGSLCWLTQDIERFQGNPQAKALVTNSEFLFILQTKPEHRQLMKDAVDLTDGALNILTGNPDTGEGILRAEGDSVWIRTNPSPSEMKFAESNRAVELARETSDSVREINEKLNR